MINLAHIILLATLLVPVANNTRVIDRYKDAEVCWNAWLKAAHSQSPRMIDWIRWRQRRECRVIGLINHTIIIVISVRITLRRVYYFPWCSWFCDLIFPRYVRARYRDWKLPTMLLRSQLVSKINGWNRYNFNTINFECGQSNSTLLQRRIYSILSWASAVSETAFTRIILILIFARCLQKII